jgi:hypothetical protein
MIKLFGRYNEAQKSLKKWRYERCERQNASRNCQLYAIVELNGDISEKDILPRKRSFWISFTQVRRLAQTSGGFLPWLGQIHDGHHVTDWIGVCVRDLPESWIRPLAGTMRQFFVQFQAGTECAQKADAGKGRCRNSANCEAWSNSRVIASQVLRSIKYVSIGQSDYYLL